ncbi:MAG: hypothetical protein LQ351_000373 [Letrouitia transgressa]|nr:MAG: hypothetical protein LQ351_000373 [Letrouitia transgressa]
MGSSSATHEERTAAQQRGASIYRVVLDRIELANEDVKLIRLRIPERQQIEASRGQWLDVHIDGLRQAGGFTITSTPQEAEASASRDPEDGYLELAIQKAPQNPPAAWLWRPGSEILGSDLLVRVGGSFVWPPQGIDPRDIKRAVFVAGGVGIK